MNLSEDLINYLSKFLLPLDKCRLNRTSKLFNYTTIIPYCNISLRHTIGYTTKFHIQRKYSNNYFFRAFCNMNSILIGNVIHVYYYHEDSKYDKYDIYTTVRVQNTRRNKLTIYYKNNVFKYGSTRKFLKGPYDIINWKYYNNILDWLHCHSIYKIDKYLILNNI